MKEELELYKKLLKAKDEYIKLLGDEISDLASFAYTHGIKSTRVEAGEKCRDKIAKIEKKINYVNKKKFE